MDSRGGAVAGSQCGRSRVGAGAAAEQFEYNNTIRDLTGCGHLADAGISGGSG